MGLLDILNGIQTGSPGTSTPGAQSDSSGMSPMTMAIIALLAKTALSHFSGNQSGAAPSAAAPSTANPSGGGGLSDILGGLLGGGAAGSVISGGLGDLLKQFQDNGQGDVANSWVSNGPNKQIEPGDLASALGVDQIKLLSSQSGMSREQLLNGLSQYLPDVVNHLTPDGRLPSANELSRRL